MAENPIPDEVEKNDDVVIVSQTDAASNDMKPVNLHFEALCFLFFSEISTFWSMAPRGLCISMETENDRLFGGRRADYDAVTD